MSRGITVTVVRPASLDDNGDPLTTDPATHEVEDCIIAPRAEGEIHDRGREGVIVGLSLYAPAGSDIGRLDLIVIAEGDPNAGTYEVEGEPGEWRSPWTGWAPGIQVALRRAQG